MKYYELDTPDGPVLEVRQDVAKKSGFPFKQVEIPTDLHGLKDFLNMLRRIDHEAARTPVPLAPVDERGTHMTHCYQGEYEDSCKYGEDDCPAKPQVESKWSAKSILRDLDNPKPRIATKMFEHDDIVDVILESRGFQLSNYFDAVIEATKRVRKEAGV